MSALRQRRGRRGQNSNRNSNSNSVIVADELEPLLAAAAAEAEAASSARPRGTAARTVNYAGTTNSEHNAAVRAALHALIDARFPIAEERPLDTQHADQEGIMRTGKGIFRLCEH